VITGNLILGIFMYGKRACYIGKHYGATQKIEYYRSAADTRRD
jgi:hypothetical protein